MLSSYEQLISEAYLLSHDDIYYNKEKFDSGEINLCFITGHSGSGKSSMGRNMMNNHSHVEHYELDDLLVTKDHFTMSELREYGDLIYSYFAGRGKKFYVTHQEIRDKGWKTSDYEDIIFKDFVQYTMRYAKMHKDTKFVLEGVWFYCCSDGGYGTPWFKPSDFDDYAFYIKGTSMLLSKFRADKRDSREYANREGKSGVANFVKRATRNWKVYMRDEKQLRRFIRYFSNKAVVG